MTMRNPAATVLIPTRGVGPWFREALDSVAAQSLKDFEVVIVDDGDVRAVKALVENRFEGRSTVVAGPRQGIASALAVGVEVAKGEVIFRLDDDDRCHPDRFSAQLDYLHTASNCVGVGSWARIINEQGLPIGTMHPPTDEKAIQFAMTVGCPFVHPSMAMRRGAILSAGNYWAPGTKAFPEDYHLWSRLMKLGPMANLGVELVDYRSRTTSNSSTSWASVSEATADIAADVLREWLGREISREERDLLVLFNVRRRRISLREAFVLERLLLLARLRAGRLPRGQAWPARYYARPLSWLIRPGAAT